MAAGATTEAWLGSPRSPRSLRFTHRASERQTISTLSVEELRSLLRSDVGAVVRAELRAANLAPPQEHEISGRAEQECGPSTSMSRLFSKGNSQAFHAEWQFSSEHAKAASEHYALLAEMPRDDFDSSPQSGEHWSARLIKVVNKFLWMEEPFKEPVRKGRLADFTTGNIFQFFFGAVVAVNIAVMACEFDEDSDNVAHKNNNANVKWEFDADVMFLALYTIELVCKLAVHRLFYFWNKDVAWNCLDFFLVVQGLISEATQVVHYDTTQMHGSAWMRMFRILKAVRILRVARVFTIFTQVHVIFNAIVGSTAQLFWSIVVLAMLFFTFAMYFTSTVTSYLKALPTEQIDGQTEQTLILRFGFVRNSMLSLFKSVYGGEDWGGLYDLLTALASHSNAHHVFIFFLAFVHIALLNIVTGIFVEHALKLSQPNIHQLAEQRFIEERAYATELKEVFGLADKNKDGFADKDELEHMVKDGRIVNFLRYLNIDPMWSKRHLVAMLDEVAEREGPDDQVRITALVERVMAVRGWARSTDIMDLRDAVWHVMSVQQQIMRKIDGRGSVSDD